MWDTSGAQPAGVAAALAQARPDLFFWQPVGNYPAATINMGASVKDAVDSLTQLTTGVPTGNSTGGPSYPQNSLILLGYSQGAIAVCHFLRDVAWKNPQLAQRILAVGVWGNPCRLAGFASGNQFSGWPMPGNVDGVPSGGIAGPDCMTQADLKPRLVNPVTHFFGDWVNTVGQGNDLYADAPWWNGVTQGVAGEYETQIYNLIQSANITNLFALAMDIFRLVGPTMFGQVLGIAEAILNGGMFAAAGPNAAHYTYDTSQVFNFIHLCGVNTPPWGAV
jgi:hypothetical protein